MALILHPTFKYFWKKKNPLSPWLKQKKKLQMQIILQNQLGCFIVERMGWPF